jgi:hypothetical protein
MALRKAEGPGRVQEDVAVTRFALIRFNVPKYVGERERARNQAKGGESPRGRREAGHLDAVVSLYVNWLGEQYIRDDEKVTSEELKKPNAVFASGFIERIGWVMGICVLGLIGCFVRVTLLSSAGLNDIQRGASSDSLDNSF